MSRIGLYPFFSNNTQIMNLWILILSWVITGSTVINYGFLPLDYGLYEEVSAPTIQHTWFSSGDRRQQAVQYAYDLGGIDFVALIECENGNWNPTAVSKTKDYGLCQLNYKYNKKFINSEDFKDAFKQLDYCYEKFKVNPKLWYWPNRKIKWQLCKDYVKDRFIF